MLKNINQFLENKEFKTAKERADQYMAKGQISSKQNKSDDINVQFDFLNLIRVWPNIIGEKFSEFTLPMRINNKTLVILTNHSTYAQHLKFLERLIIQKVESEFPNLKNKITSLYFQVSTQYFVEKKNALEKINVSKASAQSIIENQNPLMHKENPEYKRMCKEADQFFSHIDCEEDKELFKKLFIQLRIESK